MRPTSPLRFTSDSGTVPAGMASGVLLALALACGGGGGGGSTPPPVNQVPAFSSTAPTSAKAGHPYTYVVSASDADGDPVTLSLAAQPAGAALDAALKTITWTPTPAQVGAAQNFDVQASDGKGGTAHQTWSVTPSANAAPVFTTTAPAAATVGVAYLYTLATTDADSDPVTLSLAAGPAGAALDATSRTLSWTPTLAQAGTAQAFDVLADDGKGGTAHQTWSVTAPVPNSAPVFTSVAPAAAKGGHAYTYPITTSDADGDPVALSLVAGPTGAALDAASRTLSWTPAAAQVGVAQAFDVLADDGKGGTTHQTWTVTPTANAAPAFSSTAPSAAKEGHAYTYAITTTDADGDTVTLSLAAQPAGATLNAATSTISWTPATAQVGAPQNFDVLASDGKGGTSHQTWSVTPTADAPPVFSSAAPVSATTGAVYSYTPAATDADGDPVTFSLVTKPGWASLTGGAVTGTPSAGSASDAFTLRADDGHGKTVDQSWSVMVVPAGNQAPTITSTPGTAASGGTQYTYTVLATDPDAGDTVTYQMTANPTGATLTGNTLTWTPSASQERVAATFTLVAKDPWGATSAPQTWSVTPTGTISGTRFLNYLPLDWAGTGQVALDPVKDPHVVSALVPNTGGSFDPLPGSFAADQSSYTIPQVPGGSFWLALGSDNFVWTDKSQVDLGEFIQGRHGFASASTSPTSVSLSAGQMSPWAIPDLIQFYEWNTQASLNLSQVPGLTNLPGAGDTSLSAMTVDWAEPSFTGGLVDTTKGDHPLIVHAAPQTISGQTVYVAKDFYGVGSLTMVDGSPAAMNGTFDKTEDPTPFLLNWSRKAFTDCLNAVSPIAALVDGSCVLAAAYDFPRTGLALQASAPYIDLVRFDGGTGTTDLILDAVTHVQLPPNRLTPVMAVEVAFKRSFQLPSATLPALEHTYWVNAYRATLPDATHPITPLVTPATGLQFNGVDCSVDVTVPVPTGATHTLAWTAPPGGAKAYRVTLFELKVQGGATTETFLAYLHTPTTSIQVPPGLLVSGHTYSLCVRAIASPSWDPTTKPFGHIETAAYGYAEATSGIITIP